MVTAQELGETLKDSTVYCCASPTCGDNGGVCILIIPDDFEPPTSCTNPESFTDNGEEPDCKREEI